MFVYSQIEISFLNILGTFLDATDVQYIKK